MIKSGVFLIEMIGQSTILLVRFPKPVQKE